MTMVTSTFGQGRFFSGGNNQNLEKIHPRVYKKKMQHSRAKSSRGLGTRAVTYGAQAIEGWR